MLAVFDGAKTDYEALLRIFWEGHDPAQGMRQGNDVGTQYRSGIYWTTETQREAAIASREMFQAELSAAGYGQITTEIVKQARSTTPRTTTSSTSSRTRTATAGSAARASRARSGFRRPPEELLV